MRDVLINKKLWNWGFNHWNGDWGLWGVKTFLLLRHFGVTAFHRTHGCRSRRSHFMLDFALLRLRTFGKWFFTWKRYAAIYRLILFKNQIILSTTWVTPFSAMALRFRLKFFSCSFLSHSQMKQIINVRTFLYSWAWGHKSEAFVFLIQQFQFNENR